MPLTLLAPPGQVVHVSLTLDELVMEYVLAGQGVQTELDVAVGAAVRVEPAGQGSETATHVDVALFHQKLAWHTQKVEFAGVVP